MWPFKKKEKPEIYNSKDIDEIWKMVSLIHMSVNDISGDISRLQTSQENQILWVNGILNRFVKPPKIKNRPKRNVRRTSNRR